jgi:hypothetical protein
MFRSVLGVQDVLCQSVCGADGVFASNHRNRCCVIRSGINSFRNDWSDEFENVGTDRASDNVAGRDFVDDLCLVIFRVDGSVVCYGRLAVSFRSYLDDLVGLGLLQLVDHTIHNIAKHNLISRVVKAMEVSIRDQLLISCLSEHILQFSNESPPNVTSTEMNSLHDDEVSFILKYDEAE